MEARLWIMVVIFTIVTQQCLVSANDVNSCENILDNRIYRLSSANYEYYKDVHRWHNTTFWGGHSQIQWKEKVSSTCFHNSYDSVVLKGKHPEIADITDTVVTVDACAMNTNGICMLNGMVDMIKCDDDLLYKITMDEVADESKRYYLCLDRVYVNYVYSCENILQYTSHVQYNNWYVHYVDAHLWHNNSFWGGHSLMQSKETMSSTCLLNIRYVIVLKGKHPAIADITDTVVTVDACAMDTNGICVMDFTVYMIKCDDDLLYKFTMYEFKYDYICMDRVYVDYVYSCENILEYTTLYDGSSRGSVYNGNIHLWHNTAFWGGHSQIQWKESSTCLGDVRYVIVLKGKHPDIADITDTVVTVDACAMVQNGICVLNGTVDMIKCDDDLLYKITMDEVADESTRGYVCMDRFYVDYVYSCENILEYTMYHQKYKGWRYNYNWYVRNEDVHLWHNTSFWGGHSQIQWKETVSSTCFRDKRNEIVLKGKHPDIADITDTVLTVDACAMHKNGSCVLDGTVDMIKCDDDLLYKFTMDDVTEYRYFNMCMERFYVDYVYSCENILEYTLYGKYNDWYLYYGDVHLWHNTSFWGGHVQIPWKETVSSTCFRRNSNIFVLKGKHPDIADITDTVVTVDACAMDKNGKCVMDVTIDMIKCDDDLLYKFTMDEVPDKPTYLCRDKVYVDLTCDNPASTLTVDDVMVDASTIVVGLHRIETGWYSTVYNGKQFDFPTSEDADKCRDPRTVFSLISDSLSVTINETPVRITLCWNQFDTSDNECVYIVPIYVRKCDGHLQYDMTLLYIHWTSETCLVHNNTIKVLPDIGHTTQPIDIDGIATTLYRPYLQFRCSFDMDGSYPYMINWYVNGTLQQQVGPVTFTNETVYKGDALTDLKFGYEVACGVTVVQSNTTIPESESLSDDFYVGWKFATSIELSKSGYTFVNVEQTVPIGCSYVATEASNCLESLSLVDPSYELGVCTGGIRIVNANDTTQSHNDIQMLKLGETWDDAKQYMFKISTIDNDYDDKTQFDLQLLHATLTGELSESIGSIHVDVILDDRYRNRKCSSHVDPHMRTSDGRSYEQQREGDHMLFRNSIYQTEVQESAMYCYYTYTDGPVCACGIAIKAGADVFMINRCNITTVLEFSRCDDGGILDVERIHDYHYKVRTPIGTIVDIELHRWVPTMNIDIYMSAKDMGNSDGLCGYFDGDPTNDFIGRDGQTSNGNNDYLFSDSWRLSDEENLFINKNRTMEHWNMSNGGTVGQPCSRPTSITKYCAGKRRKRADSTYTRKATERLQTLNAQPSISRKKRNTEGFNMTATEAMAFCNNSIYQSPAFREFSDKLIGDDPAQVITNCVYDITKGKDTIWAKAHVNALNNIVMAVLELNPVYSANHTDIISIFLAQTCLDNCSGNGACSEAGLCTCNGNYRGPDCGTDIRIPPIVYDVEGGGICNLADGDECRCFAIRTDNIFEGFMYDLSIFKIYFNGIRVYISTSRYTGEYEDIFTGEVCVHQDRKRRSDSDAETFIYEYEFAISNDGNNFGDNNSVYIFDTTCLQLIDSGPLASVELKAGFCFIDASCVGNGSIELSSDGCYKCDPNIEPYSWTQYECGGIPSNNQVSAVPIPIVIGSFLGFLLLAGIFVYMACCKRKKRKKQKEHPDTPLDTFHECATHNAYHIAEPLPDY